MGHTNFGKHLPFKDGMPRMRTAPDQQLPAASIYDRELEKIYALIGLLQQKWSMKEANNKNVRDMQVEATNRFADLGFKVVVGVDRDTHLYTFDIIGRTDKHEFDPEEKSYEVKKAKAEGKIVREL